MKSLSDVRSSTSVAVPRKKQIVRYLIECNALGKERRILENVNNPSIYWLEIAPDISVDVKYIVHWKTPGWVILLCDTLKISLEYGNDPWCVALVNTISFRVSSWQTTNLQPISCCCYSGHNNYYSTYTALNHKPMITCHYNNVCYTQSYYLY